MGGNFLRGCVHFPVTTENNRNQNDLYRAPTSFMALACRELLCGQEKDTHKESKEGFCFPLLKLLFRACKVHHSRQEDAKYSLFVYLLAAKAQVQFLSPPSLVWAVSLFRWNLECLLLEF